MESGEVLPGIEHLPRHIHHGGQPRWCINTSSSLWSKVISDCAQFLHFCSFYSFILFMSISLLYIFTLSFRDYIGECKCVNVYCSETHKPRKPRAAVSIISCNPATLLFPDTLLFSSYPAPFSLGSIFLSNFKHKIFSLVSQFHCINNLFLPIFTPCCKIFQIVS